MDAWVSCANHQVYWRVIQIPLAIDELACLLFSTAHKNVKVFISHCGLLGSQEAMYHGTPIVGMPFFGDQIRNMIKWQDKGFARAVHWNDLSEDLLIETISDVMNNPK